MNAYALRAGVTFCRIGENNVFLDIVSDRYFCLQHKLNAAFTDLVEQREIAPPDVEALRAFGVLVESSLPNLAGCHARSPTANNGLRRSSASAPDVSMAIVSRARWTWRARNRSLSENLARLERRRSEGRTRRLASAAKLERVAAAYRTAAMFWSEYGRCLPTSMALFDDLVSAGHPANLVLGVHLQPFHAHCWVELGGRLVTDDPDRVGQFTPIRVV